MKSTRNFLYLLTVVILSLACVSATDYQKGQIYYGFKLLDKRFVKEVNAECLYFQHVKSGAKLFKIAADDANKTFMIAFKTDPESDAGTPHIMEHSVLNGSKKFPVKSPFDVLSKTSLNTFINAFTGDEMTAYPAASKNEKDYFNLMDVYLDAVFHPRIYDDPRILKQEGWHYELTAKENPIEYKGVVYNEMKGAYSNPERELSYQVQKHLYPNNNYRFSAGGYPPFIPTLEYDYFLDYHRKYYHPSNSHILLYGNADLDKELGFIDREYLSAYTVSDFQVKFPLQPSFDKMKVITAYYSATEGSDTQNQTYITLNYLMGLNTDLELVYALDILTDVLVNIESAPIRLALQEAGIGKDAYAYYDDMQQILVQMRIQNANPEDKPDFLEIVHKSLQNVVKNGLDKDAVESILNRLEFNLREGDDAQKGLNYGFQILNCWFFADNPFVALEYETTLARLKEDIANGYLEQVVQKHFLDNKHLVLLDLQPKPGLEKENNSLAEKECAAYKEHLNAQQIDGLIKETEELIQYQKQEDTPEALATIPVLELKDVNPAAEWYAVDESTMQNVTILHHSKFTNNVVYVDFYYDARTLPQELVPYAGLLSNLLGSLSTENYSYGDLDKALTKYTGGFNATLSTFLENRMDDSLLPKFVVESKAMNTKLDKLCDLSSEIVNHTKYVDKDRLKVVLDRHQARLEADVKQNGMQYAIKRMESYYSNRGMFIELTSGLEYYWFITELANSFDNKSDDIIANLNATAELLFNKNNLIITVTGAKDVLTTSSGNFESYIRAQPEDAANYQNWKFSFKKKNEGLLTASKVQYVLQGYDLKKLGYTWDGKIRVMNKIVSRDWLFNRIRVVGGAYGGGGRVSSTGRVYYYSYRDPNLKETLDNFDGMIAFLNTFDASDKDMTGYILGTIGDMDSPLTPSQQGSYAVAYWFQKTTPEEIQQERDQVLSTTADDVRTMSKLVADLIAQKNYCVYGNEEKIKANKELFGELVPLIR